MLQEGLKPSGGAVVVQGGLHITACGRDVVVPQQESNSVNAVKKALQRELRMHGQEIELYDNVGLQLVTDGDLSNAIKQGSSPLTATLSEASIHYIENRREELSQMQWKLVRDKVDRLAGRVDTLNTQLQSLTDAFSAQQMQQQEGDRRLQMEVETCAQEMGEQSRQLGAQLAERVEAVSQIAHSERNMREALKEGIGRQVQNVRDALEADRVTRKNENIAFAGLLEDLRRSLQDEGRARESLEDRRHQDMSTLQDRIDTLSRFQADSKQDLEVYMKQLTTQASRLFQASQELEDNNRQALQLRSTVESAQVEANSRFQRLEDRSSTTESRLSEVSNRAASQFNQLWTKTQSIYTTVEQVRLKDRGDRLSNRVEEVESTNASTVEASVKQTDASRAPASHTAPLAASAAMPIRGSGNSGGSAQYASGNVNSGGSVQFAAFGNANSGGSALYASGNGNSSRSSSAAPPMVVRGGSHPVQPYGGSVVVQTSPVVSRGSFGSPTGYAPTSPSYTAATIRR